MLIELRKATKTDGDFIAYLIETTMRAYVERTWGAFSQERTRQGIKHAIEMRSYSIIRHNGEDIGALAVEREATHIQLAQIYILPSHQNRGIGTELIRNLAREAKAARNRCACECYR